MDSSSRSLRKSDRNCVKNQDAQGKDKKELAKVKASVKSTKFKAAHARNKTSNLRNKTDQARNKTDQARNKTGHARKKTDPAKNKTAQARNKKGIDTKKKIQLNKKKRRDREKKRRESIKKDPKKYALYLEKARARRQKYVQEGKVNRVCDMTERQRRVQRKKVCERVRKHRMLKREALKKATVNLEGNASDASLETITSQQKRDQAATIQRVVDASSEAQETTPVSSTKEDTGNSSSVSSQTRQKAAGQRQQSRNKKEKQRKIAAMKEEIVKLKRKVWKLEKAETRRKSNLRSPQLTPRTAVKRLCRGQKVAPLLRRKLFEGAVLSSEIRASCKSLQSYKQKQILGRLISGKVLKSYGQLHKIGLFSLKQMRKGRKHTKINGDPTAYERKSTSANKTQKILRDFFFNNEASTECPGRKQGRVYDGENRQRRYLRADLKTLHRLFLSKEGKFVSYKTFCRNKPAWVIQPKLTSRDTCLCKVCENFKLLFKACKLNKLLSANDPRELIASVCCADASTDCYLRDCVGCKSKTVSFIENHVDRIPVRYSEWVNTSEKRYNTKTKKEMELKITKKISKYCTIAELKELLSSTLAPYMAHIGRFWHQTQASDQVVKSLDPSEAVFLIDWSMNYVCKYGREPQSVHFGASQSQVALHTGRVYLSGGKAHSFCTLSDTTRHDPRAITAHLVPILAKYLTENPSVTKVIFFSDGPTTQYRNRDTYYLASQYLTEQFPQISEIEWLFSEAGHGKGEADGVGGTTKRTADNAVALGNDVDSLEKLLNVVVKRCPSVLPCDN